MENKTQSAKNDSFEYESLTVPRLEKLARAYNSNPKIQKELGNRLKNSEGYTADNHPHVMDANIEMIMGLAEYYKHGAYLDIKYLEKVADREKVPEWQRLVKGLVSRCYSSQLSPLTGQDVRYLAMRTEGDIGSMLDIILAAGGLV